MLLAAAGAAILLQGCGRSIYPVKVTCDDGCAVTINCDGETTRVQTTGCARTPVLTGEDQFCESLEQRLESQESAQADLCCDAQPTSCNRTGRFSDQVAQAEVEVS